MAGQTRTSDIDVDTTGFLAELNRRMKALELRTEDDVLRLAVDTQNRARQLCPVDTGRLRSSIVHDPGRDQRGFYVDVGTNVEYGPYVEYGTSRMRSLPFLRPGLAEAVAGFAFNRSAA